MSDINEIINEFADLHNKIKPLQIRYEELKKQLAKEANENMSLAQIELSSELFTIIYSKPAMSNTCTLSVQDFIAETGSYESLTILTTAAKANLPKEKFEELFTQVPSKSRKLLEVLSI